MNRVNARLLAFLFYRCYVYVCVCVQGWGRLGLMHQGLRALMAQEFVKLNPLVIDLNHSSHLPWGQGREEEK